MFSSLEVQLESASIVGSCSFVLESRFENRSVFQFKIYIKYKISKYNFKNVVLKYSSNESVIASVLGAQRSFGPWIGPVGVLDFVVGSCRDPPAIRRHVWRVLKKRFLFHVRSVHEGLHLGGANDPGASVVPFEPLRPLILVLVGAEALAFQRLTTDVFVNLLFHALDLVENNVDAFVAWQIVQARLEQN